MCWLFRFRVAKRASISNLPAFSLWRQKSLLAMLICQPLVGKLPILKPISCLLAARRYLVTLAIVLRQKVESPSWTRWHAERRQRQRKSAFFFGNVAFHHPPLPPPHHHSVLRHLRGVARGRLGGAEYPGLLAQRRVLLPVVQHHCQKMPTPCFSWTCPVSHSKQQHFCRHSPAGRDWRSGPRSLYVSGYHRASVVCCSDQTPPARIGRLFVWARQFENIFTLAFFGKVVEVELTSQCCY